ncbi:restriction endonuclease subunit S [Salinivibrio kushneri]|uniref:Restriction endonuclease subunit S n=1 Tax=Salinivibrio kushneri TaxID=1908198 RepID=A0AB36JYY6_9GAMM|nr:restriction endonuclease subunit S [Salinivibrio kushneri]OOE40623.1 restriction endonuclease subunit S [Salinivibrio kushneri]QCP03693.1 restriction endonuclease subunit S [Salinivibrio kushneri]
MSFETATLDSLCELIVDCPHSTPKWTDEGIIVLRNQNIRNGVLDLSAPSFTNEEDYLKRIKRAAPKTGDIVFTREAPMGEVCMIPEGVKCCLGQRQVLLRPKSSVNGQYLFWALQSPYVQQQIAWNEGTGSTVSNVRIPVLKALHIPRIGSEDMVAKSLSDIASRMALNTQTNQTLEAMAQAIFKSWFVDFDPVKAKMQGKQPEGMDADTAALFPDKLVESELGLIPEGWEAGELSDLMDFNPKRTLRKGTKAPYLDMKSMPTAGHLALDIYEREMGSGTKFINGDVLLARITPCLENGKTAYVDFLKEEQVGWGSTEYIVMRSKADSYKYFSYFIVRFEPFRKFAIQSMTGTSGRQRAQAKTVQTMPFVVPPPPILEKFDELIAANMKLIKRHGDENKTLANLRDTLLPKLLSDELPLEQAEKLAEVS